MGKWNGLFADSVSPFKGMTHTEMVDFKRSARMTEIDNRPSEIRALIHEYGYTVVKTLLDVGVTKPRRIRHVVETVLNEFSPTRGSFSSQGTMPAKGGRCSE